MNIREIRPATINNFDIPKFKPEESKANTNTSTVSQVKQDKIDINTSQNWQHDVLLAGLDMLENKIQMANNNNSNSPLDKIENKPIETLDEAMKELLFTKSDLFKQQASQAQANISPDILLDLMSEFAA